MFLGFASCGECGYAITAEKHTKKSGREYVYYRCTFKSKTQKCQQSRFLREERLAAQIKEICQNAALPDEWRDRFLERIDEWQRQESHATEIDTQNLKNEIQQINAKIDRLIDLFLDGTLEEAEFKRKKNLFMEEKAQNEQRINDFERGGQNWLELTRNWVHEASACDVLVWEDNFTDMKNLLLTIGSNRRIAAGVLAVEFKEPWAYLAQLYPEAAVQHSAF